ncbi:hypothetical protein [Singulisphaera sp. PoT]|uniref:hypothetical protein n=1 Tax=Singulisphaera sp. PoT TaxID=3411797 RepID=UPI003BF47D5A
MSLGAIVSKYYDVIDGRIHGEATIGNVCFGFAMRPLEEPLPPGKQRATLRVLSGGAGFTLPVEVDRRLTVEWDALSKAHEFVGRWHWRFGDPIWNLKDAAFIRELVRRYLRHFARSDFRLALDLVELEDLAAERNRRA